MASLIDLVGELSPFLKLAWVVWMLWVIGQIAWVVSGAVSQHASKSWSAIP